MDRILERFGMHLVPCMLYLRLADWLGQYHMKIIAYFDTDMIAVQSL